MKSKPTTITAKEIADLPSGGVGVATKSLLAAWVCKLTKKAFPRAETVEDADWMMREALRFYKANGIEHNYSLGEK